MNLPGRSRALAHEAEPAHAPRKPSIARFVVLVALAPWLFVGLLEAVLRQQGLVWPDAARWFAGAAMAAAGAGFAVHVVCSSLRTWTAAVAERDAQRFEPLPVAPLRELEPVVAQLDLSVAQQHIAMEAHKRVMADASHQLRTPLAVLRTQLQTVLDGDIDLASQVPELLRTVDRATAVALEMLSRLKIEQRQRQPVPWATLRIEDLAKEAAIEFAPLIAKKHLEFALDAETVSVSADAWMLGELVRNLLANAIQHSPDGADIGIVVRSIAGRAELIVWDCGSGISDAQRERLFEPFAAAEGGSGVGLGLSICRQFARALGAEVHLFDRIVSGRLAGVDAVVRWDERPGLRAAPPTAPAASMPARPDAAPVHLAPG